MKQTVADGLRDGAAFGEAWIERHPRVRPANPLVAFLLQVHGNSVIPNMHQGHGEIFVVSDKTLMQLKNIHVLLLHRMSFFSCLGEITAVHIYH
ncbi:hypothetical protein [Nonomuraea sediminis]|uniref:hypothetical protein n=1 Tax=Nonomuraea sediminis TaxID=2835864 RepID=UPI002029B992|nr:hypothetical protein [Nonomuraea sediminis]